MTLTKPKDIVYLDYEYNIPGKTVALSDSEMNRVQFNYPRKTSTSTIIYSSQTVIFSPEVKRFDCSLAGSGQYGGGGYASSSSSSSARGGDGGRGGKIINAQGIVNPNKAMRIVIGSSGAASTISEIGLDSGYLTRDGRGAFASTGFSNYPTWNSDAGSSSNATTGQSSTTRFLYPSRPNYGYGGGGGAASASTAICTDYQDDEWIYSSHHGNKASKAGGGGGDGGDAYYFKPGTDHGRTDGGDGDYACGGGGGGGYARYDDGTTQEAAGFGGSGGSGAAGFIWYYE